MGPNGAVVGKPNWKWNDRNCYCEKRQFICELPLGTEITFPECENFNIQTGNADAVLDLPPNTISNTAYIQGASHMKSRDNRHYDAGGNCGTSWLVRAPNFVFEIQQRTFAVQTSFGFVLFT